MSAFIAPVDRSGILFPADAAPLPVPRVDMYDPSLRIVFLQQNWINEDNLKIHKQI